jgi:serine/threonine-protein kinase
MKRCPRCQRTYERTDIAFCLDDGGPLVEATGPNDTNQDAFAHTMAPSPTSEGPVISGSLGALGAAAAAVRADQGRMPDALAATAAPVASSSASLGDSFGGASTRPAAGGGNEIPSGIATAPVPQSPPFAATNNLYPPSVDPLVEGAQVGEYVVGRKIGEGGMGVIYAGVHPIIGKKIALKVLNREMAANPDVVARFIQEAKSVNQIGHRNIVDIFSFGRLSDGRHYFAMEFLEGQSLSSRLAADIRIPWSEAIQIWLQVSAAIDAAHQQGIVHRDLKPDNIFLSPSPEGPFCKVLDFGIAKLLGDGPPGISKTGTGVPIGTPAYMSPEQARGAQVDHRTDLYAFGIIMYETIAGRPPFLEQTFVALLTAHLTGTPPPLADAVDIHPELNHLVTKLLLKEPGERYPDMATVRAELIRLRDLAISERMPLYAPLGELAPERRAQVSTEERAKVLESQRKSEALSATGPITAGDMRVVTTERQIVSTPAKKSFVPYIAAAVLAVGGGGFGLVKVLGTKPPPPVIVTPPVVTPPVVAPPPVFAPTMPPNTGRLILNTNVNGTKIFLDKSEKEKSAEPVAAGGGLLKAQIPSGVEWILRVEADGYQTVTMPLKLAAGEETALPVGMAPIGSKVKPTVGRPSGKGKPGQTPPGPQVAVPDKRNKVDNPNVVDPF